LKIYDELPEYLRHFEPSEREMKKYIIGTIGDIEPVLSPREKGEMALVLYIRGITDADLQREKEEILSCTMEDIRSNADIFQNGLKKNLYCVFGNESKLNEDRRIFDNILRLK
jgi:Zn-dependent M16 (insulinase) family peptidase